MANVLGLAIGFALGGAGLLRYLPQLEAMRGPPAASAAPLQPAPGRKVAVLRSGTPDSLSPVPLPPPDLPSLAPVPLPEIVTPGLPGEQDQPSGASPPKQPGHEAGRSGTGFFISSDGLLLTAAHVVVACRRTQVMSRLLAGAPARVLARDETDDIALLRAEHVHVPGILPVGRPAGAQDPLFLLGYPASAGTVTPEEAWGTLENARLPDGAGRIGDPRYLVWLQASAVRHGYSGGPILDPRNGAVVGLVKGTIDSAHSRAIPGLPGSGMVIGPGAAQLTAFVQNQVPWLDVGAFDAQGDDAVALARRATVHVYCWH